MSIISATNARFYNEGHPAIWRAALREELAAQKDRLILWIPVFLAIGIGVYFSLRFEPPLFLGLGGALIILALWVLLWPLREAGAKGYGAWLFAGALALMFMGFTTAQLRTIMVATPMLKKEMAPIGLEGRIAGIDRLEEGQGTRLILDSLDIERLSPAQTPARVRIKVRQNTGLHIGDRIQVLAGLNPPSSPVAPGAFDFQRYAYFKKLGAFGFTYRAPEIIEKGAPSGFRQKLENIRQTVRQKIEYRLSYPEAAIATALMTGERTAVAEEDWEAMRAAGLAHMLAISGLHVGLVASVIFMAVRLLMASFSAFALRHPVKKYAALIALMGAFGYMLMVGMTIPTLRALLMTGIVLLAIMIDRVPFSLRLVAIAASVILLLLPESLLGASFQMSFAAVTALIFFYEIMRPYLSRWYRRAGLWRRLALYFIGVCLTTVIATLATGPLGLFHFQQLAVYSMLSNLFAVPLMAFIVMPTAVLSYLLMPLGLEGLVLPVTGFGIKAILSIAHGTMSLPHATWTPPVAPFSALLCIIGAALFCVLWKGRGRVLAFIPLIAAFMILQSYTTPDILVTSSGKLVALRDQKGQMWISSKRNDRFSAEIWARRYGHDPETLQHWRENSAITCGESGCRMVWPTKNSEARRVAVSFHAAAQAEDCAWADIVISTEPLRARPCPAKTKIGFFDLWRNGAYALWPNGTIKTVDLVRGQRPWTISNRR